MHRHQQDADGELLYQLALQNTELQTNVLYARTLQI